MSICLHISFDIHSVNFHCSFHFTTKIETMEDWDQETLEKVVQSKSEEYNKNKPTDIVSILFSQLLFYSFMDCSFSV